MRGKAVLNVTALHDKKHRLLRSLVVLHSSREAGSAQGPPSATERRECKSRVTLLLRDADSGQIDHMAAEPTHGPHHPHRSPSPRRAYK